MTDTRKSRPDAAGETAGSTQRLPERFAGRVLTFDLGREQEQLRQEESYRASDRNAKTLVKEHGLSVVLTVMRTGARLQEHKAAGPLSIQALAGQIRLHALGDTVDLPIGHVATLGGGVAHDVEAVEESAFLLTIAST